MGGRDEDCSNNSSCHLASVRSAEDAPNITHHAAEDGQQTDMIAAVDRAERSPEERTDPQEEDLRNHVSRTGDPMPQEYNDQPESTSSR